MDGPEFLLTPTAHPYHLFTSLVLMSHLLLLIVVLALLTDGARENFAYSFMDGPKLLLMSNAHPYLPFVSLFLTSV